MNPLPRRVVFRSRPPRVAPHVVHVMRPVDTSRAGPIVAWDDPVPRAELHDLLARINDAAGNHPLPLARASYADRPVATVDIADLAGLAGGRTWEDPCEG